MKITRENIHHICNGTKEAIVSRYFYFLLGDDVSPYDDKSDSFILYRYIAFSYYECNRLDSFIISLISKGDCDFIRAQEDYMAYENRKFLKLIR